MKAGRRLAVLLLLGTLPAGRRAAAVAPPTIVYIEVPNASFEQADGKRDFPAAWTSDQPDVFTLDTDSRHGTKSLHINIKDKWANPKIEVSLPDLPEGRQISFACWMKTKDLEKPDADWKFFKITLEATQPDGTTWSQDLLTADGTSGWRWYTVTDRNNQPITTPDRLTDPKLVIQFNAIGGEVWVDRIVLVEGTELPPETVTGSQSVTDQTDEVRTALNKARAAVLDKTLELSPREAVSDTQQRVRSLDLLVDLLVAETETLKKAAGGKPHALARANEAADQAARARALVQEADATLAEAERVNETEPSAATEAASAPKVQEALLKLQEAVRAIGLVETAASKPLILAGSWGGDVWRLDDVWEDGEQKEKWSAANTDKLVQPYALFVAASPDGELYEGGLDRNLYRSDDNGGHWTTTPTGLPAKASGLAIDPLAGEHWLLTSWGGGAWWSETEGRSWTRSDAGSLFLRGARALKVAGPGGAPRTSWYAIADGATILSAKDFGGSWTRVATLPRGIQAWDVAAFGDGSGRLLAATDAGVADIAPDGTVTFPKLPVSTADARSVVLIDDLAYIGTAGHGVVEWNTGSKDPVTASTLTYGLDAVHVSALAVSSHPKPKAGPEELSASIPRFWTTRSNGLTNLVIGAVAFNPKDEKVVFCGTRAGFFRSEDRGGTWVQHNDGLTNLNLGSIVVDPNSADTILVAPYWSAIAGGIHKSTDGGKTWAQKNNGLTQLAVMGLSMDPTNPNTLYASTWGTTGGVFQSTDEGENWSADSNGITGTFGYFVLRGAFPPSPIFAGMDSVGLFRWDDGAKAWKTSANGLSNLNIWSLAQDPKKPDVWLCGTAGGGLFKSVDGGVNWTPVSKGLTSLNIFRIAFHPKKPGVVYLGTRSLGAGVDRGVFRSADGGDTWAPDSDGLTNLNVGALMITPAGVVYVGTDRGLFYKLD